MNSADIPPTLLALVACGVVILTIEATAQKGGKGQTDTPVTSAVVDAGDITLSTNHRIQSDGLGSYVTFSGLKDAVKSVIQTSNQCCQDWELDMGGSRTRSILMDLRDPVPPNQGTTAPFDWEFVRGRLIAKCHVVSSTSFPGMTLGQSLDCPLLITFPNPGSSSTYWRMALNPIAYPETDYAQVSCVSVRVTGSCNGWTIESGVAQADGGVRNVGRLEMVSTRGNTPPANHGPFYLTFSIQVTNP